MNRAQAEAEIKNIFSGYRAAQPGDAALLQCLSDGKLYELFVLSHVVEDLANRGFTLRFIGTSLKFKGSPGMIKPSDPHFEVGAPSMSGNPALWLYVDIEFDTLGHHLGSVTDNSRRHEIDIVVITSGSSYPSHHEIALGVECKAVANFGKDLLKEALGVRRELGVLQMTASDSLLTLHGGTPAVTVSMNPPSEYWLAHTDPRGGNYAQSPAQFGVTLKHLEP
ncbi:hypothetical protein [Mesorhizobium sp. GR13]|uniref:hypothetical protein n=1 Tax=Mesorhizobium sp. GR13 TaxID=2562308 RepID=UPI0010C144B3|nr:hypothetical protein [Mesorhizobium sp. GR13]